MFVECPKCRSFSARYKTQDRDVVIKCLCGYLSVVASTLEDGIVIEHPEVNGNVCLPRKGSKLYMCFIELAGLKKACTSEIADSVKKYRKLTLTTSEVASHMTILRYKGLVSVVEEKKGVSGGSTWKLTDSARSLI